MDPHQVNFLEQIMLSILDVTTAKRTILNRTSLEKTVIPEIIFDNLEKTFGERIQPSEAVRRILEDIRIHGDNALRSWTKRIDNADIPQPRVSDSKIKASLNEIDPAIRSALEDAAVRIRQFHQKQPVFSWMAQSMGGTLGQLIRPIHRVGFYVPGGTAPLPSTILMSVIPAIVAGVKEIVITTPPRYGSDAIDPAILAAAAIAGVDEIYIAGGAQAIAIMAYGSESITPVDKIVGPGNLFVTLAKQQVFGQVGIDGLAGPTETIVIADESANPKWIAADLLAQAEHDLLATAILITPSETLAKNVCAEIDRFFSDIKLKRAEIIRHSLKNRGGAVITKDIAEAITLSNAYAPEHLNLAVKDAWNWIDHITNTGGIFIGEYSCEVMGDYIAGPSHVMPTSGSARFSSPLNVTDFIKIISLVGLNQTTASYLGSQAEIIARAEGLDSHALAAKLRSV
jgi:histidinol dehydrogenase